MTVRVVRGDVRGILPRLAADSFDCIVTSPPYYGLRDYNCAGQIGLEPTLDAYLDTMVAVCRELRRVLKPGGVFFLDIGDSYNGGGIGGGPSDCSTLGGASNRSRTMDKRSILKPSGLKPKDLMLVPERLGIALQADGWWVRSHVIWAKPNPMPESCTDRPTSAHETIWMLARSARYFWDAEAVKEPSEYPDDNRKARAAVTHKRYPLVGGIREGSATYPTRNLRNVWTFASHPFPDAHFATFPPELAERCIKAGSSERGCCPACGAPWVRLIEKSGGTTGKSWHNHENDISRGQRGGDGCNEAAAGWNEYKVKTLGWQPSCRCSAAAIPARILDPFAGAGTTGLVADRLGRDCTLIDLNTEYAEMALNRIRGDAPLFVEIAAE